MTLWTIRAIYQYNIPITITWMIIQNCDSFDVVDGHVYYDIALSVFMVFRLRDYILASLCYLNLLFALCFSKHTCDNPRCSGSISPPGHLNSERLHVCTLPTISRWRASRTSPKCPVWPAVQISCRPASCTSTKGPEWAAVQISSCNKV